MIVIIRINDIITSSTLFYFEKTTQNMPDSS
jgi:hypothetical protein